jgi:TonB family protein
MWFASTQLLSTMTRPSWIRAGFTLALLLGSNIHGLANHLTGHPSAPRPIAPLRLAVIGLTGPVARIAEAALADSFAKDERVRLLAPAQVKPAVAASGYDGSINLTTEEAKHLGAAIGCDFFIIGKTDSATRSERAGEAHEETFIGVLIVDGRSGALSLFDFILQKATRRQDAEREAAQSLSQQTARYIEPMMGSRVVRNLSNNSGGEVVEDLPDAESAAGAGFKAPEFLNRVKPEFTDSADRADVNATVEAKVIFRASGEIGDIEIIRWAGFGLEDAAIQAIRQLKFKPATRNGQPVSTRAVIRYNFRRVNER